MNKKIEDFQSFAKELKPFRLYGEDIDFIVKKGGKIETKEDLNDFFNDNFDLLQLIFNYEDKLIRVGKGSGLHDDENIKGMMKKLYRNIKKGVGEDGCGFDEKKYKEKDFYNLPIIEFKKLFD